MSSRRKSYSRFGARFLIINDIGTPLWVPISRPFNSIIKVLKYVGEEVFHLIVIDLDKTSVYIKIGFFGT